MVLFGGRSPSLSRPLFLLSLVCILVLTNAQTCINLPVSFINDSRMATPKDHLPAFVLHYIGTYSADGLKKPAAMKFAMNRINSQFDILPNVRLELYGQNVNNAKSATLEGAIAAYHSTKGARAFIGGETFTDNTYVQYMASSFPVPQINPSSLEASLYSTGTYPTLLNMMPSSADQQYAVLTVMKHLGIKTAMILLTNNQYGNEFNSLVYHPMAVANNMTFQILSISTSSSAADTPQKLQLAQQYIPQYRYVICHGAAFAITGFIKSLGDLNLTGPSYLYIFTHQVAISMLERPNNYRSNYFDGSIGIAARSQDNNTFANEVLAEWANASPSDFTGANTDIRSSWHAFDTVYAYAYALDAMLKDGYTVTGEAGKPRWTGDVYYSYIKKLNFTGVTGRVNFDGNGRPGFWDVVNFNFSTTASATTDLASTIRAQACFGCTELYSVSSPFVFYGGNLTVPPPFIPCPQDCTTCTPNGQVCTVCAANKFIFQGLCVSQCPNSTYANTTVGQCLPTCLPECAECTPDGSVCLNCSAYTYLFQGICLGSCPNSTFANDTLRACVSSVCQQDCIDCAPDGSVCYNCSDTTFKFQGICLSQCPNSTAAVGSECFHVKDEEEKTMRKYIPAISIALGVIIGIAALFTVFAALMLVAFWTHFSKHGSFYCAVIIAGVFVTYIAPLVLLPPPSDALCLAFPWFLGIGFTLVYGCLFIKTWALFTVYRSAEKLKKTRMTPMYIIARLCLYVFVEVVFLIIWAAVDRPKAEWREMVDDTYQLQCATHPAFWAVFAGTKGLWLLFGSVLSILTRHVAKEYNESKSIAYAIYNIIALLIIAIPLAVALQNIPGGLLIIEVGVVVIALSFTVFSLFFPIWYGIFFPSKVSLDSFGISARSGSSLSPSRGTSNSRNTSQGSLHNSQNSANPLPQMRQTTSVSISAHSQSDQSHSDHEPHPTDSSAAI